jgi:23S rRNA (cytidine1920-2'-O)/16S rRNA (cytidine1409-2'-O)-methyltransferase
MQRERIDKLLVDRGLVQSRTKAQAMIMAGIVLVNDQLVNKPSESFPHDASIRIKGAEDPAARYVGRGGLKLEAALREFRIDAKGLVCLDVGASTGGFTDCMLQNGALRITALDVGHHQFDWRLRNDPRVELREGVNARYLKPTDFENQFDLITIDVSFISLTKILPAVVSLLGGNGQIIALIKPQFEVGKGEVGKRGIVTDPEKHQQVIEAINRAAAELGLDVCGLIESPVLGAEGNREFLALYKL